MTRLFCVLGLAAFCSNSVLAQAPSPRPVFDIAGIQVSNRPQPGMRGGVQRGTRYELRNAHMVDLIRTAYNVQPEKISGGPSWIEWNRFDIAALAPENTPPERLREMLKTLLAELSDLSGTSDDFKAKLKVLVENVEHHVEEEEGEMFPMVEDQIEEETRIRLGSLIEAEKSKVGKGTARTASARG